MRTDPISYNLYIYTDNNPIGFTDPSGEDPVSVGIVIITGLVITGAYKMPTWRRVINGPDKDINEIYSSNDFVYLPKESKRRISRALEHYKIIYPSVVSLRCGDAAGSIRDQFQKAFEKEQNLYDVSFETKWRSNGPPDNYATIKIKSVPGYFRFYGGSIGGSTVVWINN